MRKIVFIISTAILLIGMSGCKSKEYTSSSKSDTLYTSDDSKSSLLNPLLTGKRWKLVELFGNPVSADSESANEAFLLFQAEDNRISGNFGCNTFSSTYELKTDNRIKFSKAIATMKMCLNNMDVEDKFKEAIDMADSFYVDNDQLILNRARMAPLAKFVAVANKE